MKRTIFLMAAVIASICSAQAADGINRLIQVQQHKADQANDEALTGADKQRELVRQQQQLRDKQKAFENNTAKPAGTLGVAVALGCSVGSASGFTQISARNTSPAAIPAGKRIKWSVNYSMTAMAGTGPDGKPKSMTQPGTSTGEIVLTQALGTNKSLVLSSSKSSGAVSYKNCTAFAAP